MVWTKQATIIGPPGVAGPPGSQGPQGEVGPVGPPGPGTTPEEVQDVVGAMATDSTTIDYSYNDTAGTFTGDVRTQMSLTSDASGLRLQGDAATPGNSQLYGTDSSGVKGWYAQPGEGGAGTPVAFRGCYLTKSTAQTGVNASAVPTPVSWDVEQYDTNTMHDNATNNTRITIPAGVTRVQLQGGLHADNVSTSYFLLSIRKNGTTTIITSYHYNTTVTDSAGMLSTPVLDVVAGDYFELCVRVTDASIDIRANLDTFFACEIVEPLAIAGVDVETIQDTVGAMATDSATIDLTYNDAANTLSGDVKDSSITYVKLQNVSATDRLLGRSSAGAGVVEEIVCTPLARTLLDDTTQAAMQTTLGVAASSAVQPLDATLTALAGLATGANQLAYSTGTDTFAQTPLTAAGRALLDDADNVAQRTTLGLGTAALTTYDAGTFTVTATGFSGTAPSGTAVITQIGKLVTLELPALSGTSNAQTWTLTGLPAPYSVPRAQYVAVRVTDNGFERWGLLHATGTTLTLYPNANADGWTASGTKLWEGAVLTYRIP